MATTVSYRKVYETLRAEILGGRYLTKREFPSSMTLARRFGVTRFTVRQALDLLVNEGLLRSQRGRGTFVTRTGANRQIGLIVPGVVYSEFFQPIVAALSGECQKNGYGLTVGSSFSADGAERARQAVSFARDMAASGIRGVILQPIEMVPAVEDVNRQIVAILREAGVAIVLLDSDFVSGPERSAFDLVGIDNYDSGRRVAWHLIERGAHRICFATHPYSCDSIKARCRGVRDEVARHKGVSFVQSEADLHDERTILWRLVRLRPDAVVCGYDTYAASVKCALEKARKRVPKDILLAGFDDLQDATLMVPSLTTTHQPCAEIARNAFRMLVERMADPAGSPRRLEIYAPLVVRESTNRSKK